MEKTIEVTVDIDDVWSEMTSREREEFITKNLSDADESQLKDYCIDESVVSISDFDTDDIIEYLEASGYYVTQNPPTEQTELVF